MLQEFVRFIFHTLINIKVHTIPEIKIKMMIKKLKKIYRILFPKTITGDQKLETMLLENKYVSKVEKVINGFKVEINHDFSILIRDLNHSDFKVFQQVFNYGEYESVMHLLNLNNNFNKPHIIIDAGANVGMTSLYLSFKLKTIEVYAIEPDKNNFELLYANCSIKRGGSRFVLYNRALAESRGKKFLIGTNESKQSDWALKTEESDQGTIEGITVDEIIEQNSLSYISLLKIDIEGAERFIFRSENDLSFLKMTYVVAIEIHDEFVERQEIYKILLNNNFVIFEDKETTVGINQSFFIEAK